MVNKNNIICMMPRHIERLYEYGVITQITKTLLYEILETGEYDLQDMTMNYGCYLLSHIIQLHCEMNICELNQYEHIFIPTYCKRQGTDNFEICGMNDNSQERINYVELRTKYITIGGFFYPDPINILLRFKQFNPKTEFARMYIAHMPYSYILLSNIQEIYATDYKLYNVLKKVSVKEITTMFENVGEYMKYKMIFLLLLTNNSANNQIASILLGNYQRNEEIIKHLNISMQKRITKKQNGLCEMIMEAKIPQNVKTIAMTKLEEMTTITNDNEKQLLYIRSIIKYPWTLKECDNIFNGKSHEYIDDIMNTLDSYVYGHDECKYKLKCLLAKFISNPTSPGTVIGLYGPSGVGKTLIAESFGKATKIPFVKISLGGHNDSGTLFGFNYTYSSAQPGLLVTKMIEAGKARTIIYIDELDKAKTQDIHHILSNVLDKNMNSSFQDRFFQDITFPLDKVIFILSYNNPDILDKALRDRITEIKIEQYTLEDKINIAEKYIIKEICNNLNFEIIIPTNIIKNIIENETNEFGVRELYRKLENILLKANLDKIYGRSINIEYIAPVNEPLGESKIGVVNCIYTSDNYSGILQLQICKHDTLQITGNIGDLLKESILCAMYVAFNISKCNKCNFHVHIPGPNIKDGLSAGFALVVGFVSVLLNKKVRNDVAITGEIDLMGNVLKVDTTHKLRHTDYTLYVPHDTEQKGIKNVVYVKSVVDVINDILI